MESGDAGGTDDDDEKNQALAWGSSKTQFVASKITKLVISSGSSMVRREKMLYDYAVDELCKQQCRS